MVDVEKVVAEALGGTLIREEAPTILDVHAGTRFRLPGSRQTVTVENLVRNPPGCWGKTHINGGECWENITPIIILNT